MTTGPEALLSFLTHHRPGLLRDITWLSKVQEQTKGRAGPSPPVLPCVVDVTNNSPRGPGVASASPHSDSVRSAWGQKSLWRVFGDKRLPVSHAGISFLGGGGYKGRSAPSVS